MKIVGETGSPGETPRELHGMPKTGSRESQPVALPTGVCPSYYGRDAGCVLQLHSPPRCPASDRGPPCRTPSGGRQRPQRWVLGQPRLVAGTVSRCRYQMNTYNVWAMFPHRLGSDSNEIRLGYIKLSCAACNKVKTVSFGTYEQSREHRLRCVPRLLCSNIFRSRYRNNHYSKVVLQTGHAALSRSHGSIHSV